ncbi:MAG: response regulator transcription factor [Acidobacteria bacterium]|jgi:DNA-binding NarL/FixJ family response regulator|nr:response regulator transcription factor [Acidobacteriota bacterium]
MDTQKKIKVMVIGDFLIFRNGLKLLLETEKNIKVVGEAANLSEASDSISKTRPDILLVDSSEADKSTFTSFVSSQPSYISIIILTNSSEIEMHRKYLMLGVNGVVTKEQTANILFKAINKVHDGEVWFVRKLMNETIRQLITEKKSMPEEIYSYNCSGLSTRERDVLILICQGMKNKIIADKLFISETTVRHHLTSIFEKLNVTSRLELVVHAFKEKLVEVPVDSFEFSSAFK